VSVTVVVCAGVKVIFMVGNKIVTLIVCAGVKVIFMVGNKSVTLIVCAGVKVIFMVGNKSDLDGQRDVTFDEAKQFAEENGM